MPSDRDFIDRLGQRLESWPGPGVDPKCDGLPLVPQDEGDGRLRDTGLLHATGGSVSDRGVCRVDVLREHLCHQGRALIVVGTTVCLSLFQLQHSLP